MMAELPVHAPLASAKPNFPLAKRLGHALAAGLMLVLAGCGLGQDNGGETGTISDPVVAAKVNGQPIYVEDVRTRAVQAGRLQEGEDLNADSDAFYQTLEELIQFRLFSLEAEARGLDRQPDIRRRLEAARERVLAASIYEEIDRKATDPNEIERLYRENASRLGQGQEVHLRHIQFDTREAADAAKRRLDAGERFEALAFELSTDRDTAADGGDLGFRAVSDLTQGVRDQVEHTNVGQVFGPIQVESTWQLIRVEDRRERGVPSLETLRPRIIEWLRFQQISELQERLERDARIERLREQPQPADTGGDVTPPADAGGDSPASPPGASSSATQVAPGASDHPRLPGPAFPFPMGPGGVYGGDNPQTPATPAPANPANPAAPAAQTPRPAGGGAAQNPRPATPASPSGPTP
jgi:peptidyl-prolyl cis-trans isomerase C